MTPSLDLLPLVKVVIVLNIPQSTGTVVHTSNPSTQEAETGRSEFEASLGYTKDSYKTQEYQNGYKGPLLCILSRCYLGFIY